MSAWRPLRPADVPGMIDIAAIVHPGLPESAEVLAERIALFPEGCFGLDGSEGLAGYLLSHPWRRDDIPALNRRLGSLPERPDCYYIHDLALHPAVQRTGAAGAILGRVLAGHAVTALVAVNGTAPFWSRHGFVRAERPGLAAKLDGYGPGACYMLRQVSIGSSG